MYSRSAINNLAQIFWLLSRYFPSAALSSPRSNGMSMAASNLMGLVTKLIGDYQCAPRQESSARQSSLIKGQSSRVWCLMHTFHALARKATPVCRSLQLPFHNFKQPWLTQTSVCHLKQFNHSREPQYNALAKSLLSIFNIEFVVGPSARASRRRIYLRNRLLHFRFIADADSMTDLSKIESLCL